ncbi:Uncharacterised protein [Rothia kristinae]|nr:Uncharacterised protein [Rothia kristinae]
MTMYGTCAAPSPASRATVGSPSSSGFSAGMGAVAWGSPSSRDSSSSGAKAPVSYTATMHGWFREATASASRWKRARKVGSFACSGRSTLMATCRPRRVSSAA